MQVILKTLNFQIQMQQLSSAPSFSSILIILQCKSLLFSGADPGFGQGGAQLADVVKRSHASP